ncbi:hypothetical protein LCGC14_2930750, partial [marine sediment metagenome]
RILLAGEINMNGFQREGVKRK